MITIVFFILAAFFSGFAALVHIGCMIFGSSWYRFFGAGKRMEEWADAGDIRHILITGFITVILTLWSLYALSGAEIIPELPLLNLGLWLITSIYLLRGLAGLVVLFFPKWIEKNGSNTSFVLYSSLICVSGGMLYFIGLLSAAFLILV